MRKKVVVVGLAAGLIVLAVLLAGLMSKGRVLEDVRVTVDRLVQRWFGQQNAERWKNFETRSLVEGWKLEIVDPGELAKVVDEFGVFKNRGVIDPVDIKGLSFFREVEVNQKVKSLSRLRFELTNTIEGAELFWLRKVLEDKNVQVVGWVGASMPESGLMVVQIRVRWERIAELGVSGEDVSSFVSDALVEALYEVTYEGVKRKAEYVMDTYGQVKRTPLAELQALLREDRELEAEEIVRNVAQSKYQVWLNRQKDLEKPALIFKVSGGQQQ